MIGHFSGEPLTTDDSKVTELALAVHACIAQGYADAAYRYTRMLCRFVAARQAK